MPLPASYTTVENVKVLVTAVASVTTLNSEAMAAFIGRAQAMVDAALAKRYNIPFGGPPPIIETVTTDIAAYEILRRLFTQQRANKSEWAESFKDTGAALLKSLAEGKAVIVTASGTVLEGRNDIADVWSSTQDYLPTFHEGPAEAAWQDPDKIDDLLRERDAVTN